MSAVLAPPHDRGVTWSKWRLEVEPQLRHAPPSRCQRNSRVSTLMRSVSVCAAARRGVEVDGEEVDLRRMGRLRSRNGRSQRHPGERREVVDGRAEVAEHHDLLLVVREVEDLVGGRLLQLLG